MFLGINISVGILLSHRGAYYKVLGMAGSHKFEEAIAAA